MGTVQNLIEQWLILVSYHILSTVNSRRMHGQLFISEMMFDGWQICALSRVQEVTGENKNCVKVKQAMIGGGIKENFYVFISVKVIGWL